MGTHLDNKNTEKAHNPMRPDAVHCLQYPHAYARASKDPAKNTAGCLWAPARLDSFVSYPGRVLYIIGTVGPEDAC